MTEKTMKSTKKNSKKTTRPTLSQQVKQQAGQIEQMQKELQQKKSALQDLNKKAKQNLQYEAEITALKEALAAQKKCLLDATAQSTVRNHIIASMAVSLIPVPLLDVAALTAMQLSLLRSLSRHYQVDFDEQKGKALLQALMMGSLPVNSIIGLSSIVKVVPAIGTIGGGIGMATTTGITTYATGEVFIKHFSNNGTLENFDGSKWRSYFKEKLQEGRQLFQTKIPQKPKTAVKQLATA